jgi:hypothetical protein
MRPKLVSMCFGTFYTHHSSSAPKWWWGQTHDWAKSQDQASGDEQNYLEPCSPVYSVIVSYACEQVINPSPAITNQFRNKTINCDNKETNTMSLTLHLALSKSGTRVEAPEVGQQNTASLLS